jgi:protocatechuate 3,4-dioxygenase beta subunit
MKEKQLDRRTLFRHALVGGSLAAVAPVTLRSAFAVTPAQTEGPFHPLNRDTDLVQIEPGDPLAEGQVIRVTGRVSDESGKAVAGALVELWQADKNGKYDHPADPLPISPDPHFQFWGRATTNANGEYSFRTIKPGAYPASDTWMRPPHLHFRIMRRGFVDLTTQMYFAGESLNDADLILGAVPSSERAEVVVTFSPSSQFSTRPGIPDLVGRFDIELEAVK